MSAMCDLRVAGMSRCYPTRVCVVAMVRTIADRLLCCSRGKERLESAEA